MFSDACFFSENISFLSMLHLNASLHEQKKKHCKLTRCRQLNGEHTILQTHQSERVYRGIQRGRTKTVMPFFRCLVALTVTFLSCKQRATVAANYACESYNCTIHLQRFLLCFVFIFIISGTSSSTRTMRTTIIIMLAPICISAIYMHAPAIVCCSVQSLFCTSAAVDVLLHI